MQNVKWGLLASGSIARAFANALTQTDSGTAAAVASRSEDKAKKFAKEFDIPRACGSYDELLADPQIDAVYISTPHPMHAQWCIKAADAGKHILCEKPLAMNRSDVDTVIDAARRNDVFLTEAFMYRCTPQTVRLVELVRDGAIGEVRMIDATFSFQCGYGNLQSRLMSPALGGGGILDVGCYTVSMSRLIAGAALGRDFADPVAVQGMAHLGVTGVDEWASALLKFDGGIIARCSTGVQVGQENRVVIYGSDGSINVPGPWFVHGREAGQASFTLARSGKDPEEVTTESDRGIYALEADVVAANIENRQAPSPAMTWADSLSQAATLDKWRAAAGLEYPCETVEGYAQPLDKRPPAVREPNKMPHGRVDGIDKDISKLVMGTMIQQDIAHATSLFDEFYARGGNAFDTAYIYGGGRTEVLLGQWMANRGLREQLVVGVKGAHTPHCTPEGILTQFNESLERLQTDYADLYFMHRDNREIPVGEFVDVLNELKDAGKIRVFGGSNWSIERFEQTQDYAKRTGKTPFTVLSNHFSLARMVNGMWDNTCVACSDAESKAWHRDNNVPCFSWSSQARGFFVPGLAAPDKEDSALLVRTYYSDDNFERQKRCFELAGKMGVHPVTIALAYVLARMQEMPLWAAIGPANLAEAADSYQALEIELSADDDKWLNLED